MDGKIEMKYKQVFLVFGIVLLIVGSGCASLTQSPSAHTVNVYLTNYDSDENKITNISVSVKDEKGTNLFNKNYSLSNEDMADESGGFSVQKNPEMVLIQVNGEEYTREWPTIDCTEGTHSGVEISVSSRGNTTVSINGICETETVQQ